MASSTASSTASGAAPGAAKSGSVRMSADDRRALIVRVGLEEFAKGGFHGTPTELIARRAGVSQPYLFRLFPNKKALFLDVAELCYARITQVFDTAAEGLSGGEAMGAMGAAYQELVVAEPELLLMQMQLFAAASQDPEIRARVVHTGWDRIEDQVRRLTGAPEDEVVRFVLTGMLCNVIAALDLPRDRYRPA